MRCARRLGQLVDEPDVAGDGEVGQPVLAVVEELDRGDLVAGFGTTMASTSSSVSSDGTPITAASSTDAWALRTFSTSQDEMFSPRRRMASFIRSTK